MNQKMNTVKMLSIQLSKNRRNRKIMDQMISKIEQIRCDRNDVIFRECFLEIMLSSNFFFPEIREKYITRNLFPKTPKDMECGLTLKLTYDFYTELRWMIFLFEIYADEISVFVESRKLFDAHVLRGEYSEALEVLTEIEKNYGVSFWLIESKLFVYNKLGRSVAALFENWPDCVNKVIVSYYELRLQEKRTYDEYQYFVDKEMVRCKSLVPENPFLEEYIPYYNYKIAPLTYELNEKNIFSILRRASLNSLIDRYLLCLDIFEAALTSEESSDLYLCVKRCIERLENIQDEKLEAIRFCFAEAESREKYELKTKLDLAKEAFVCGRLQECREKTKEIIKDTPYNIQALNLLVETDALLSIDEEPEFKDTILGELVSSLLVIYPMREQRNQKIDDTYKLLICCSQSSWASMIANTITNRCQLTDTIEEVATKKIESIQYLDMETVCNCLSKREAIAFIEQNEINNRYVEIRYSILYEDYEKAQNLCMLEELQYLLAVCNPETSIQEKHEYVTLLKGKLSTFELLVSKHYFNALDWEKNFVNALEFAVDLMIENLDTSLFIPIEQLIKHIENMDSEISSNICVPILYYIKYRYYSREIKPQVCAACEDFLYFADFEKPSHMEEFVEKLGVKRVIFFLRYVCTPEILATALAAVIDNSLDLAQERLDICQILCKKDILNEKVYEQEIRNITQKKKINSELRIIEENRIHVNIEGMRQDLIDNLKNDFARFQLYEDNAYKELLEAIISVEKNKSKIFFLQNDSGRVMRNLVYKIRDAFVSSNEYGLDGYLSLNIRHGAISDALRSPLAAAGLLTVYNAKNKEYELNTMWGSSIVDNENDKVIYSAIKKFTDETDTIINDLRTKYIRIKTEHAKTEGIFDYVISDEEHCVILERGRSCEDIDAFLNYIFEFLWNKTEKNLVRMKMLLKEEIQNKYEEAFLRLKTSIEEIKNKNRTASLLRKIVEASNEMPNVINKVCFWFQRSTESKHTEFDLDFVFNMMLETVTNMHPDTSFVPSKMNVFDIEGKIEGKYLKMYSDIFYNLLDNIYKKASRKGRNRVLVEYSLKQINGEQHIYLQNDYDCYTNKEEDAEKLKKLEEMLESGEYLKKVKGEGGTGIPKICKIIKVDLRKNGKINFGLKEEENKFFIEITM